MCLTLGGWVGPDPPPTPSVSSKEALRERGAPAFSPSCPGACDRCGARHRGQPPHEGRRHPPRLLPPPCATRTTAMGASWSKRVNSVCTISSQWGMGGGVRIKANRVCSWGGGIRGKRGGIRQTGRGKARGQQQRGRQFTKTVPDIILKLGTTVLGLFSFS